MALPIPQILRETAIGLAIGALALAGGCIHPNIPSVRGELPMTHAASPAGPHSVGGAHCIDGPRLPGGPLECPPDDPAEVRTGVLADYLYDTGKPKEPDVPWPRFHPLPTRPVLTGP